MGTRQPTLQVTIVAANAETLCGLQAYLSQAGLGTRGTRRLGNVGSGTCSAIVFFPDEFARNDVLREMTRLRRDRPTMLQLLVTREPQRYAELSDADDPELAPIVIPKPAWGWTILDAIRLAVEPLNGGATAR